MAGGTIQSGGSRRHAIISGINITPLVDVVLVLLIIFMVASTYIVAQALKVQLPKAQSSDGTPQGPATISILKNGEVRWNQQPIKEADVASMLKAAVEQDPNVELIVSADREVQHGRVVHFVDLAKVAGVLKFAINVEQGE